MKTLITCMLITVIATTSHAVFLSAFGGGGWLNHRPAPQEYLHHHHHHHEVLHKSVAAEHQQPSAIVKLIHKPVEVHPQHVEIYKVIHEHAPQQHVAQDPHHVGLGIEQGHGLGYRQQAPAHLLTRVIHPIVTKNYIHNQHEHHYHHVASGPVHHHGWH